MSICFQTPRDPWYRGLKIIIIIISKRPFLYGAKVTQLTDLAPSPGKIIMDVYSSTSTSKVGQGPFLPSAGSSFQLLSAGLSLYSNALLFPVSNAS